VIDLILKDSMLRPNLFIWRGPLPITDLEEWALQRSVNVPADLVQLWSVKGGGDLFETESILQPFGAPEYDQIDSVSETFWKRGLSPDYFVFHTGLWDSVFRKSDGAVFSLRSRDLTQMLPFRDLNDWYSQNLRQPFAEKYGIPLGKA
jgi:hypothetical protein